MSRKQKILHAVDDLVTSLMYYDRKEDEELPKGAIEEAVENGEVSREELVERFAAGIRRALP